MGRAFSFEWGQEMKRKKIRTFTAKSADGREFTIIEWSLISNTPTFDSTPDIELDRTLKTSDGKSVVWVGKGVYKIAEFGMLEVKSQDPNAP